MNIDIRYGTELHQRVCRALEQRIELSERALRGLCDKWRKADEEHIAYVKETEADARRRLKRDLQGEPQYVTLHIPYSYAVLMAAHTYWTTVFLSRSPIFQFTAYSPRDMQRVPNVEAVIDYQVQVGEHVAPYYLWLLDAGKYGLGVLGVYWEEESIITSQIVEEQATIEGIPIIGKTVKRRVVRRVDGYKGTRVYNVAPWEFLPDPRVPLHRLQDGEFCGRRTRISWMEFLRRERDGEYFNREALERLMRARADRQNPRPADIVMPEGEDTGGFDTQLSEPRDTDFVDLVEMYVELVPRDWGLGTSPYPEKWFFVLANDELIVAARPYGELHNRFPFFVLEYEPDAYALVKRSMYDVMQPLQDVMNWLVNTHFYNVRKVLNDMIVVDPSRIVLKDLLEPGPGKIIRAKPSAYGGKVADAVYQFPVSTVTNQHVSDLNLVAQMIQRVTGVTDNIMGLLSQGGRKTATEVRSANALGVTRLKTVAEYFSATGWQPLARVLVQMTQEHFTGEMELRVAGESVGGSQQFVTVTPEEIAGFYSFVPVDGTMPIDRYAQVNLWTQLLSQVVKVPGVMERFDMAKIFEWIAQLGGMKNISQFRVQVGDGEQLAMAAQRGDIVPLKPGAAEVPQRPVPGLGPMG